MSVFRCVPICPAVSRFVHQLPILQHYKSPLLCSGVTNRKGVKTCNDTGGRQGLPPEADPNPSRTDFRFSPENSKVCFVAHETVFRA